MPERCLTFPCQGESLVGILHEPETSARDVGVLIVVGGPQFRVGSHRQFVLMAREFAASGYPVLRFDYRGMGDSSGDPRTFDAIDQDVRMAIDALLRERPSIVGVVCFGLCDAASALLGYCTSDDRVAGLILANPWVRTEVGQAHAYVHHYYSRRLVQRSFWRKLLAGDVKLGQSIGSALGLLRTATHSRASAQDASLPTFLNRMLRGLQRTSVPILVQLSENDLTAREFSDLIDSVPAWRSEVQRPSVQIARLDRADHTFSSTDALRRATQSAIVWLGQIVGTRQTWRR